MTTEISREDVLKIASDLKMEITDEDVTSVLEKYDGLLADREGDLWFEIVEELLYDIISFNDAMESCSVEKCGKNGCDCLGRLDGKEMGAKDFEEGDDVIIISSGEEDRVLTLGDTEIELEENGWILKTEIKLK